MPSFILVFLLSFCHADFGPNLNTIAVNCTLRSNCSDCVLIHGCGWCTDTTTCWNITELNEHGMNRPPNCRFWNVDNCTEQCLSNQDCVSCNKDTEACSWCGGFTNTSHPDLKYLKIPNRTSVCLLSKSVTNSTCLRVHPDIESCPQCSTHDQSCEECSIFPECGWCDGNKNCIEGDSNGPFESRRCGLPYYFFTEDCSNITSSPTQAPTAHPTASPTNAPTNSPTTSAPTASPTNFPTTQPTTSSPTTNSPTQSPTESPTESPTTAPYPLPPSGPYIPLTPAPIWRTYYIIIGSCIGLGVLLLGSALACLAYYLKNPYRYRAIG